ncbi:MAG: hypothetical protein K9H26_14775 [Prolixibacteraceae bacterium]|nr:hypothetical protein [Prolixibacteraceae bacterium]
MIYIKNFLFVVLLFFALFFSGCSKDLPSDTVISDNFESGSIGEAIQTGDGIWELSIADDNDNPELPDNWRCWWYVKMGNAPLSNPVDLTLKKSGWPYYYIPVFTYDQKTWHHFAEDEVYQNEANEIIITKQSEQKRVWISRFYPYTFTDLENYLESIQGSPYLDIQVQGYSQQGKPVYLLKITDPLIPVTDKERIFMHARTHPAETPPSFMLEGLINFLLSGEAAAYEMLAGFEFYIFPMQNVDGVTAGNYRSTPKSENLEVMWYYNSNNPLVLTSDAPVEVGIVHQVAAGLMADGGPPVSIALNLHASNSEPDIRPFFFPHFGSEAQGYAPGEASLWNKQLRFISCLSAHTGADMLEPLPEEGGSSFATKTYPESWWWANFNEEVMAMTMELTYGRAGHAPRWVEPNNFRKLGVDLALAIRDYSGDLPVPVATTTKSARAARMAGLKYPELYPPADKNELKE